MPESSSTDFYSVRIGKEYLSFSAAHFITFENGQCEAVHGHNYGVSVEVTGPLNDAGYVVDFLALRELVRSLLAEWDHRVLLPTKHPTMCVAECDSEVEVRYQGRRWVFPRDNCALLPIESTTAELLAKQLARLIAEEMRALSAIRIEVSECDGMTATYHYTTGERGASAP